MEISIIGPGAVGTLLGGLLRMKGHGVTLLGRRPAAPPGRNFRIILPSQWLLVEGVQEKDQADHAEKPDAFLFTLGRHHLHAFRRPDFLHLIGKGDAPVVMFNCDSTEPERLAVPAERLRFGLTLMHAVKLQDGEVELPTASPAIIAERSPVIDNCIKQLGGFGFQFMAVDDATPYMDSFFITQLLYLPVAMCNLTLPVFLASPEGRELALSILREGFLTMERLGRPLARLPMMDPRDLAARIEKKPASFESGRDRPDRSYNSVLQSYLRGKPTEAAQLNRKAVEMASATGLHLAWNWRVFQKAGRVASLGFYRDPAELLKALV